MNMTKLRRLIRETIEGVLDDEQFGPTNRPDQNVADFSGFRGYVADRLQGCDAHSGIIDTVRTCDVGHPVHDTLWNTWGLVEPEINGHAHGLPYAEMGQVLWPYADGMARDFGSIATEMGPDVVDVDDLSTRFCGSLGCDGGEQASPGRVATFDDLIASVPSVDADPYAEPDAAALDTDEFVAPEEEPVDDILAMDDEFADDSYGDEADVDDLLGDEGDFADEDDDVAGENEGVILDPLGYDASDLEDDEEDEDDLDESIDADDDDGLTHRECPACSGDVTDTVCPDCDLNLDDYYAADEPSEDPKDHYRAWRDGDDF